MPSSPTRACRNSDRPTERHERCQRGDQHDRRDQHDRQRGHDAIGPVLERVLPALRIARADRDDRDPADPFELEIVGDALEQARQDRDRDTARLTAAEQVELGLMRARREADDDVRYLEILERPLQAGPEEPRAVPLDRLRVEDRDRERFLVVELERVVVEERHRTQPELGALHEAVRKLPADRTGTDDQRPLADDALTTPAHLDDVPAGADRDHVGRREDPGPHRLGGSVGIVEDQDAPEGHAHRDDRRGGDDRPDVLEEVGREREPVEAEVDEDGEDENAEHGKREGVGPAGWRRAR